MAGLELAQLNIAHLKAPIDSPVLVDFIANLERINRLADTADGFRWRLQTDEGNAAALRPFGDDVLINMSVWRDLDALRNYVQLPAHSEMMKRRREWFTQAPEAYAVLWWVPSGHRPSVAEAHDRLQQLRQHGPSSAAFTFGRFFPAPA
jgi:heme-degrading monooxygenase HmoA